ncbi:MAG: hypothetical protein M3Q10_11405 [Chloroflexota bacterium]|nr:hypothetical protein [Chloroflexota bacterium]
MVREATGRCRATTAAGSPCSAQPVRPSGWCYWHDPTIAAEREAARRRGGRGKSNRARAAKAMPAPMTPADLQALLGVVLRGVVAGRVEPGVGNAAANLGRAIVAVREATTTEERLAALESAAGLGTERRPA